MTPAPNIGRRSNQPFRPSLKYRPEDRPDPTTVDPTLRLDLLAKLQDVGVDGTQRSLFDFSAPPAPKLPEPKIKPKPADDGAKPDDPETAKPRDPPKPPPPPIPLKFYGYINPTNPSDKRAFFLEGDNIYVAREGDLIEKRYKVVRIGVTSAVVKDTQHDHEQTLALVAELKQR